MMILPFEVGVPHYSTRVMLAAVIASQLVPISYIVPNKGKLTGPKTRMGW